MFRNTGLIFLLLCACHSNGFSQFVKISQDKSGIKFSNRITETESINILDFDYLYNGGGIGIIDVNKDGLEDIFFSGNFVNDRLYLNKGDFKFEDVTLDYGINNNGWSTGVCVFDINNDGFDDIYVCRSGIDSLMGSATNVLYINNNGNGFVDSTAEYGLDLKRYSVQAAPLDYDLDGDLDLYIITHPASFIHTESFSEYYKKIIGGFINSDILLENRGGQYFDVTKTAGIFEYGYSLGVAITDLNEDYYPDIIVSNDFDEPDHVFINQKNGKFNDETLKYFRHTSNYSMGNDIGDFNNDGLEDYVSLDMAFPSHERAKLNMASMDIEKFEARVSLGWNYQYMHNMLQLNTGFNSFQEISYLANVAKTDWSWAPLFVDVNADGWQDLVISNGYKRDTKNNDIKSKLEAYLDSADNISRLAFLDLIPSQKIKNQILINKKNLTFANETDNFGFEIPVNSNGMAYADFNNDGLLDIVLNNIDTVAFLYKNIFADDYNYLTIDFSEMNEVQWVGAKIQMVTPSGIQNRTAHFIRGFQSTVSKKIILYWQDEDKPKSLRIQLNSGKVADLKVSSGKVIKPVSKDFKFKSEGIKQINMELFSELLSSKINVLHEENTFEDFKTETLLPHSLSKTGPVIKTGDFNNDSLEDIIIGSSVGQIPMVLLQTDEMSFNQMENPAFYNNQLSEEEDIFLTDLNGDGNLDLIFSYGGYQYKEGHTSLKNAIYLGNGKGQFGKIQSDRIMDDRGYNSGNIIPYDFNKDSKMDYLICGKSNPLNYPKPGRTSILMNNSGNFQDFTSLVAPELERIGMVEDATFSDVDGDGDEDIILIGEWMDLTIFINNRGRYSLLNKDFRLGGWWNKMIAYDFDGDGDDDFLVGNAGINNKLTPDILKPLYVYMNDFDDNGSNDIVLAVTNAQQQFPLRGKECSSGQMPFLNEKFKTFESYAQSDLSEIYSREKLDGAYSQKAVEFRSGIIENTGDFNFKFHPFDHLAQVSALKDFEILDLNGDGKLDIIGIGNEYGTEVETTRNDAGNGTVLIQKSAFDYEVLSSKESGFYVKGDAKSLAKLKLANGKTGFVVGVNSGRVQLFEVKQ